VQGLEGNDLWQAVGRRMVHEDDGKDVRRSYLKRKRELVENKSVNNKEVSEEKLNEDYEKG
jgi:hypothetical protein